MRTLGAAARSRLTAARRNGRGEGCRINAERGPRRTVELAGRGQSVGALEVADGAAGGGPPNAVDVVAHVKTFVAQALLRPQHEIGFRRPLRRRSCRGTPAAVRLEAGDAFHLLLAPVDDRLRRDEPAGARFDLRTGRGSGGCTALGAAGPGRRLRLRRALLLLRVVALDLPTDIAAGERAADRADAGRDAFSGTLAELIADEAAGGAAEGAADEVPRRRAEHASIAGLGGGRGMEEERACYAERGERNAAAHGATAGKVRHHDHR